MGRIKDVFQLIDIQTATEGQTKKVHVGDLYTTGSQNFFRLPVVFYVTKYAFRRVF